MLNDILMVWEADENEELYNAIIYVRTLARPLLWGGVALDIATT